MLGTFLKKHSYDYKKIKTISYWFYVYFIFLKTHKIDNHLIETTPLLDVLKLTNQKNQYPIFVYKLIGTLLKKKIIRKFITQLIKRKKPYRRLKIAKHNRKIFRQFVKTKLKKNHFIKKTKIVSRVIITYKNMKLKQRKYKLKRRKDKSVFKKKYLLFRNIKSYYNNTVHLSNTRLISYIKTTTKKLKKKNPAKRLYYDSLHKLIVLISTHKFFNHKIFHDYKIKIWQHTTNTLFEKSKTITVQNRHNKYINTYFKHRFFILNNKHIKYKKYHKNSYNSKLKIKVQKFNEIFNMWANNLNLNVLDINSMRSLSTRSESVHLLKFLTNYKLNFNKNTFLKNSNKHSKIYLNCEHLFNTPVYNSKFNLYSVKHNAVKKNYSVFYTYYILNFLEIFLKKKLWIRVDTQNHINQLMNYINNQMVINKLVYNRYNRVINCRTLIEIITIMFISKDIQILLFFLKQCFEQSHFKTHKKILIALFDVLKKNQILFKNMGIKGFFFDIRGKVGVTGNAKKRHFSFSMGKITTTSQNVRSNWQQINIWTPTGQMGITCYLIY